jgi:hypothetical protein
MILLNILIIIVMMICESVFIAVPLVLPWGTPSVIALVGSVFGAFVIAMGIWVTYTQWKERD